jgi:hypothetical protein
LSSPPPGVGPPASFTTQTLSSCLLRPFAARQCPDRCPPPSDSSEDEFFDWALRCVSDVDPGIGHLEAAGARRPDEVGTDGSWPCEQSPDGVRVQTGENPEGGVNIVSTDVDGQRQPLSIVVTCSGRHPSPEGSSRSYGPYARTRIHESLVRPDGQTSKPQIGLQHRPDLPLPVLMSGWGSGAIRSRGTA